MPRLTYGELAVCPDCAISVKDSSSPVYAAHRAMLIANAPHFRAIIDGRMTETETGLITLSDVHDEELRFILDFIYHGRPESVDLPLDRLLNLWHVANRLECVELSEFLCSTIAQRMSLANFAQVLMSVLVNEEAYRSGFRLGVEAIFDATVALAHSDDIQNVLLCESW